MTEMEITYVFVRYISVTIQRQSKAFYRRYNRITYHENKEFIDNIDIEQKIIECYSKSSSAFYGNFEEKLSYQELLYEGLSSLNEMEKYIIYEKYLNKRSDVDIGKEFSISSQMVSKRKRKILSKLKNYFLL